MRLDPDRSLDIAIFRLYFASFMSCSFKSQISPPARSQMVNSLDPNQFPLQLGLSRALTSTDGKENNLSFAPGVQVHEENEWPGRSWSLQGH